MSVCAGIDVYGKFSSRRDDLRKGNCNQLKAISVSDFESVGKVGDFEVGRGRAVPVDGRMVAVFHQENGEWHAIDDLCPHMGASLAEGFVEDKCVTCPWHAWRFDISDGTWVDNPRVKVDSFEVKVEGDEVFVRERKKESDAEASGE